VLVWGEGKPELVFLHGGGQNAHTWDLVITALGRPAIAIDLPGHGHSSWCEDRDYGPGANAPAVAQVVSELAPAAVGVIGMSLGGLTLIRLAAARPELVRRAVIVDVTPGSGAAHARMSRSERGTTQLMSGPPSFASLEEMVDLAVRASPRRPASAIRRGVQHNSRQQLDGTWTWRYDPRIGSVGAGSDFRLLWDDVAYSGCRTASPISPWEPSRHLIGLRLTWPPPTASDADYGCLMSAATTSASGCG